MLHFTNSPGNLAAAAELTVLERQRARLMWEGQKGHDGGSSLIAPSSGFQGLLMMAGGDVFNQPLKTDPDWPELTGFELPGPGFGSCARPGQESPNSNKRKFDKEDDGSRDKKNRGLITEDEEYSKITEQSSNTTATTTHKSKNSSRNKETSAAFTSSKGASDVQKSDFIHVRARRGQATDSHSLAERARREKISERMKYLQDLVPGCDKITGKAGMLDEIINYVQSLQRQVEFLSMKLATVNPVFDLNIDNLLIPKEQQMQMFPPFATSFPAMEMLPEMSNPAAFLQMMNSMQQAVSCPNPETFSDTSWFNQVLANAPTTWDSDIHPQIQRY